MDILEAYDILYKYCEKEEIKSALNRAKVSQASSDTKREFEAYSSLLMEQRRKILGDILFEEPSDVDKEKMNLIKEAANLFKKEGLKANDNI